MFFAGGEPDHVAGVNLLDGAAFALCPAAAGGHDQGLAERVGVPGGAGAGLEGDAGAGDAGGVGGLEKRVDSDCACEPIGGAFFGWLCADAFDFHG